MSSAGALVEMSMEQLAKAVAAVVREPWLEEAERLRAAGREAVVMVEELIDMHDWTGTGDIASGERERKQYIARARRVREVLFPKIGHLP